METYRKEGKEVMPNKEMTKKEFERGYAQRSNITLKQLHKLGLKAHPCDCDFEDCQGWQMLHISLVKRQCPK